MKILTAFSLLLLLQFENSVDASFANGSVRASSGAFSKILKAARVALVKFDDTYPFGEKHDEYKKVAEASMQSSEWMCVEIGVADYGDKDNYDLAERFSVKRDDFPAYFLFKNADVDNPLRYKGSFKADELMSFVSREGGVYIGLSGTVQKLDKFAEEFIKESDQAKRKITLAEATAEVDSLSDAVAKENGKFYLTVMGKVLEKASFIDDEIARIGKLKDGKVSDAKRKQMTSRLNILTTFRNAVMFSRNEL